MTRGRMPPRRRTAHAARRAPRGTAEITDIGEVRARIDAIDDDLVELLNRRAALAEAAGAAKARVGKPAYVPERERQVMDRVTQVNPGPLGEEALRLIYREILSASRALESPLVVAYFGPEASFTHEAAKRHFGLSAHLAPRRTIAEVFDDVERSRAAYGVVPIENSTEGMVNHTHDLFVNSELFIGAEVLLDVHQNLLSRTGELRGVTKVYSHPQGLAQCRGWLERNLPGVPLIDVSNTARGAQLAAEDSSAAAVAGELAAQLYHLQTVASHIEDMRGNMTRFLVIGHDQPAPTGNDRSSIMFSLHDKPGILYRALSPFARAGINLSRIESRPSRKRAFEYVFFIDLEGHQAEKRVARAIETLRESCDFLKVLGSYPRGRVARAHKSRRDRKE